MSHNTYNKELTDLIFKSFQKQALKIIDKLSKSLIRSMQAIKETPTSSDDSGLENLWDEYCFQCQSVENIMFETYQDTISGIIEVALDKLKSENKEEYEMVFLYYSAFEKDNIFEEEDCYSEPLQYEIARHILSDIRHTAANYSNKRLSKALDF